MAPRPLIAVICAVGALALACGKWSPTDPTGPDATVNSYVAELTLPGGVTGTLNLRASGSFGSLEPGDSPVLARVLGWLEPALAAQSSTATGLLVTSDGNFVTLSGTFSGGTFNVSGGGYTIVAAVASTSTSTSISGTATVPGGGTVPVTAPPPLPVTDPVPANPVGTYTGTFQIQTVGSLVNTRVSDNVVVQNCIYTVVINGTISLRLFNVLANGMAQSELTTSWTESGAGTLSQLCGVNSANGWGSISPGPGFAHFEGPPSSLVYVHAGQTPNPNGMGNLTRSESYLGTVSGNTVVMKVSRSFQFVNQLNTTINGLVNQVMGYPTVSVMTTLVKQ